ncbi:MAG TPA: hypothetical protein VMI33_19165 [Streptosporangiaceae bacterium]|nr:hypothetical protein [Streptosporangiaceae bacterium]
MGARDGRVAVITGAGRGPGRERALLIAAESAQVVADGLGGGHGGRGPRCDPDGRPGPAGTIS